MVLCRANWLGAVLGLCLLVTNATAQWSIIAPRVLTPGVFGAIYFKDGVLWAGMKNVVYSKDTGKTWKTAGFTSTVSIYDDICDMSFLNRDTGIISTYYGHIYITHDSGDTWT